MNINKVNQQPNFRASISRDEVTRNLIWQEEPTKSHLLINLLESMSTKDIFTLSTDKNGYMYEFTNTTTGEKFVENKDNWLDSVLRIVREDSTQEHKRLFNNNTVPMANLYQNLATSINRMGGNHPIYTPARLEYEKLVGQRDHYKEIAKGFGEVFERSFESWSDAAKINKDAICSHAREMADSLEDKIESLWEKCSKESQLRAHSNFVDDVERDFILRKSLRQYLLKK